MVIQEITLQRAAFFTQSSSTRPGTRSNSLTLFVTRTAPAAIACPAMAVSFGPIGVPARRSATRMSVVASTAARSGQDGIEARAERVDQLNMARRGLRAGGAEAHLGIRHGRDHDAITAQHRLFGRFSTAAGCSRMMNEQMLVSSIRVFFMAQSVLHR